MMAQSLGWLGFALALTILFAIVFDKPAAAQTSWCSVASCNAVSPETARRMYLSDPERDRERLVAEAQARTARKRR